MEFKRSSTGICLLGLLPGLIAWAQTTNLYRYQDDSGVVVVDWRVPAEYVDHGYEVLDETGRVLRVVPRALTDSEKRDASKARDLEVEAIAEQERLQAWDESLLLRYSTTEDIEAARDRLLRELDILIAILNSQRDTLSQQLERHQAALDATAPSGEAASQYEEETVASLQAEIQSLDEVTKGRQQQSAALAEAYGRDIARFAELEEIVALRRQMSVSPSSP